MVEIEERGGNVGIIAPEGKRSETPSFRLRVLPTVLEGTTVQTYSSGHRGV
jgi:hypothetical protein